MDPSDTLSQRLQDVQAIDPGARALQVGDRWYTWGDLTRSGNALQELLSRWGADRPGVGVAVVMRNGASTVAAALSVVSHQQALITLSDMMPNTRLAETIRAIRAVAVIGNPQDWTDDTLASTKEIGAAAVSVSRDDPYSFEVLLDPGYAHGDVDDRIHPGVALEMMTSGTTGPPKRIPLTYKSIAQSILGASHYNSKKSETLTLRPGVAVVALPMVHMGGIWTTLLNYATGRPIAMLPRFEIEGWIGLIREHRPVVANVPPAALTMLLDRDTPKEDLASLKALTVGTAPVNPSLAERFEEKYGIAVLTVYGATEFGGGVAGWTLADWQKYAKTKRGSVGRPHHNVELRVVDRETFQVLPPGEVGLLEVKSEQLSNVGPDGWMRTNDLATLDQDGFLWIKGRADDVIIRGGFKISAGQVADALRNHPAVKDAAVVGIPDERLGKLPVAAVELNVGHEFDESAIRQWLRDYLTPYQIPAQIIAVDALPRNPALKVDASGVRALFTSRESRAVS